jgi:hypothetical protein|tara:strand:+ start:738 stop:911 length:174 start_codon:yes stop_codon:yes gene_type:complete
MLHDIFLLPISLGQYLLSAIAWYFLFAFIVQSDKYYDTRDWLEERYADYKEKKNARN